MSLDHFIVRRSVVIGDDGRRYVCRGPTVATVHLALGLFSAEIMAARGVWEGGDAAVVLREALQTLLKRPDGRIQAVMATCVECDVLPADLLRVGTVCFGLCDIQRVVEGLTIPDADDAKSGDYDPDPGPDPQTVAVVRLAQEFSCSPMDVLEWPYEALLDTLDTLNAIASAKQKQPNGEPIPDPAAMPGILVSSPRMRSN